ncbi:MAG: hypothetical protein R3330_15740, partial [Saprospiraceae bacterium]|nr:hypothetical protein [Saprospiraceae bacterium]
GPGAYAYGVTVTDANGCTATAQANITIYVLPTVTASAASEFCGDQTIALNATGVQGGASITGYNWTGPNGFTSSVEDPTILPTDPNHPGAGNHTYFVTVTDGNGCTATASVQITVYDNPTVTATSASQICSDAPIVLEATGVQGSAAITGYAWSGPLGYASSNEDPVISTASGFYPGVGTFIYTVTVTDANGCTDVASVSVTITGIPSVLANTSTPVVCSNESIVLTATGTEGSAAISGYAWTGPNSFSSLIEDPTILPTDPAYPLAGTHVYNVTVTDVNGCTATASVQVVVNANPTVTATAASEVCGDQSIILNATGVQGSAGITGYAWSGPNGFSSSLEDPTIAAGSPNHPGSGTHTYFVTVTDANGCTGTDDVVIIVHANPSATISAAASLCGDAPIVFNATAVEGSATITTYAWTGPAG